MSLRETWILDSRGSWEERMEARSLDTDEHWWEVPEDDLKTYVQSVGFLDPEGLRYYVPAVMTWKLRKFGRRNDPDESSLLFILAPRHPGDQWFIDRWKLLDTAQRSAVCRFLRFLEEFDNSRDAEHALRMYWGRHCRRAT